ADQPVVGDELVHDRVRRPAAARRPGRGPARPAPHVRRRPRGVQHRVAGRRARADRGPAHRRPAGSGHRRRDGRPEHDRAGRAAGYLNFLLGPAAMMSMFFFLTQFLQNVRGFSALATGFAFLPMAVAMFAMTRAVPRLLTQLGPRPLVVVGTSVMVVGLAWLS